MAKRVSPRLSRLEQLPDPIVEDILRNLTLHDLLAARLASKFLSTTAAVLVPGVWISSEDVAQASHVLQTFPQARANLDLPMTFSNLDEIGDFPLVTRLTDLIIQLPANLAHDLVSSKRREYLAKVTQVVARLPNLRGFQNGGVRDSLWVTGKHKTRLDSLRLLGCNLVFNDDAMCAAVTTTLTRLEVERSEVARHGPPTHTIFKTNLAALTGLKSLCVREDQVAYGTAEWLRDFRQLTSLTLGPAPGKRKSRPRNDKRRIDLSLAPLPRLRVLNLEVIITPALLSEITRLTLLEHLSLTSITPGTPEKLTPELVQQCVTPLTCLTYLKLDRFPFGVLKSLHALFTGNLEGAPGEGQRRCEWTRSVCALDQVEHAYRIDLPDD